MPTIRAALDQLRESDDVTLVEVKEPGEHVRVAKEGGSIVVDVEEKDETVHVSTPIRAISSTVEQLAASAPSI
jgi:prephenate dehydrogenase